MHCISFTTKTVQITTGRRVPGAGLEDGGAV